MQGILLAAGYGRRFDPSGQTSKLLARLPAGRTVAAQAARTLCAVLPGSVAVIRPGQIELAAQLRDAGCHLLESVEAEAGMGSALAHAVRETRGADGWLVALADMPWVPAAAIRAVAAAIDTPLRIAAAAFDGQRGHPVAFGAHWAPELVALGGRLVGEV
ncbi:MAG: molybdopterin-guanine dinucleotide biosynthesis protein MobA, partial [Methyloversatilis sp. 12-65-5]